MPEKKKLEMKNERVGFLILQMKLLRDDFNLFRQQTDKTFLAMAKELGRTTLMLRIFCSAVLALLGAMGFFLLRG